MSKQVKITFTVTYETVIEIEDDENVEEIAFDVNIPESSSCKYVEDSFEIESEEEV